MKINKMMRIASVLMVAVLLSTCAIFSTFAKYVTRTTGTDTARVAYWGFEEPTGVTFPLFVHNDESVITTEVEGKNLIAPGTSGSAKLTLAYKTSGTITAPEVAYNYAVAISASGQYTTLDSNENFKWTLKKGDDAVGTYSTFADLQTAVAGLSHNVEEGDLPMFDNVTIGWVWEYQTDGAEMVAQDINDTTMGNAADLANVTITLTITATQLN